MAKPVDVLWQSMRQAAFHGGHDWIAFPAAIAQNQGGMLPEQMIQRIAVQTLAKRNGS